ncbi:MAG: aldolase/citrate lyase family protein [Candidatus Bathyarchaeia archaeon]|jgi:2-keto-3-deoxy-L-rhamnonate aldolase RhmA
MNPVKEKLQAGKATVGTWVNMGNPDVAEQLSMFGFDWLTFDLEHGLMAIPDVQRMMQAMNGTDCVPLVRVPINEPVYFKWALDIGAYGVVVPYVNTKEEASRAVNSCMYPPQGIRGCGPRRVSRYYADVTNYVKRSNDEVLVVVMIESQMALDNLDEILSVPGIDAVFVGPDDLSLNLGIFQQRDHPKFKSAISRVLDACKKHRVAPGMHCNENNINDALSMGFRFCALNDDDTFLTIGAKVCLQGIKGWKH